MRNDELQALFAAHGGVVGATPLNPESELAGVKTGKPNPNPTYRYTLRDGETVEAVWDEQNGSYQVLKSPKPVAVPTEKPQNGQTRVSIQGNREVQERYENGSWTVVGYRDIPPPPSNGPTSRPPEPNVNTSAPKIPVWNESKKDYDWIDNPNYKPPVQQADVRVVGDSLVDGKGNVIYTKPKEARYFQTADAILEIDANGNSRTIWSKSEKPTVLPASNQPTIAVQNPDGTIAGVKNPAYTSQVQQILQNQYDTIDYIRGLMEKGQITPAEANAYMTALRQQTQAALAGTTPYQQQKDAEDQKITKAQLARDVLTNRVNQSSGLAQKLIDTIKPTGITGFDWSKVDPFGAAAGYVDERMGGRQVGDLASALLMGLQSPAQTNTLPANVNWAALGFNGGAPAAAPPAPVPAPVNGGAQPTAHAGAPASGPYTPDQLAAAATVGVTPAQYVAWEAQQGGA